MYLLPISRSINSLLDYIIILFNHFILFNFYSERLSHENITFNDNGTVSTIPQHPLEWQGHLSNGTEDDLLFLPNIALLVGHVILFLNLSLYAIITQK